MKLLCLVLIAAAALAQTGGGGTQPGDPSVPIPTTLQLMKYLDLTPDQLVRITAINGDYMMLVAGKSRRMAQVQQEIAEETAKSPLDPMALGVRYAELEATRRELRAEEAKLNPRITALLSDAQRAKLKTLDDAMKLQPLICEALSLRLLVTPEPAGGPIPVNVGNPIGLTGVVTFLPIGAMGCGPVTVRPATP